MKLAQQYAPIEQVLPQELPPLTRIEAQRAARLLIRHFTGKPRTVNAVRRCWLAVSPPYNEITRGWRRLIHDLSHTIMYRRGHAKPHSGLHARLELEVAQYVLAKGWLSGSLKPAPVLTVKITAADKRLHLESLLDRWEGKQRRCQSAIKKLRTRIRYYQRQEAV